MAFRAPPYFCAETTYEKFLPLRGFSPAKSFCSNLAIHQRNIKISAQLESKDPAPIAGSLHSQRDMQCPAGSTLCSLLTELQASDKTIARNVCRCIGVYILVPGITSSEQPATESTSNPTITHPTKPTLRHSSEDTDNPTMISLPKITSIAETAATTSIASDTTIILEGSNSTPNLVSLPTSAWISNTMSSVSAAIITTSSSASSSTSCLPSMSTCTSTGSIPSGSICPAPSSSCSSSPSSSSFSSSSICSSRGSASCSLPSPSGISRTSSISSTTSSATAIACSPTCTYPTATLSCPTVTATGLNYRQYYAGQCLIENIANPGTGSQSAIYTRFRGVYDICAVTQYCANSAAAAYGQFYSFDLHYTCSNASWMCVQYYSRNSDASYFNVPNMDVAVAVGYSYELGKVFAEQDLREKAWV